MTIISGECVDVFSFGIHAGMNISVHSNLYVGMPQNFAETLDIHSAVNTVCGKSMPQDMKVIIRGVNSCQIFLKMILISPGFHWFILLQDIFLPFLPELGEE